jgi:hypothetical protein
MEIGFFEDEMRLKTILLIYDLIITSNASVSCVMIGLKE